MKLDAAKFHKFLKKSSLNYYFPFVMCRITPDGLVAEMTDSNYEDSFFYMSKKDKEAITGVKKSETLYFPIYSVHGKESPGWTKGLFKGDKDIYEVKRENLKDEKTGNVYPALVCTSPDKKNTKTLYAYPEPQEMNKFEFTGLKPALNLDIDEKFIREGRKYDGLCKAAKSTPASSLMIAFDKGKVYLNIYRPDKQANVLETPIGKIDGYFGTSFCELDVKIFSRIFRTIDPKGEYVFSVMFDPTSEYGYISIESKDKYEKFILIGKKVVVVGDIIDISNKINLPALPDKGWSYPEAVNKLKGMMFSWKKMTDEMYLELCLARKMLSLSKSDAARKKHNLISPAMTWTTFCQEIGSTRQSVDRWLNIWEEKKQIEAEDKKDGEGEKKKVIEIPQEIQEMITASLSDGQRCKIINGLKMKKEDLENSIRGENFICVCRNMSSEKLRNTSDAISFVNGVCLAFKSKDIEHFVKTQKARGAVVVVKA